MRLTGLTELAQLYKDLEGDNYTPSSSYSDIEAKLRNDHRYIANMRVSLRFYTSAITNYHTIEITLYDDFPSIYHIIEFRRPLNG